MVYLNNNQHLNELAIRRAVSSQVNMSYSGKNAVIIGGTHGMGLATASLLISQGAKVILTGRSEGPIESAKAQLGEKAHVLQCDIASLPNIEHLTEEVNAFLNEEEIDFLFLNAGYAALEPFESVTETSFARTINTNLCGAFFAAQRFTPLVREGGAVVFTSSVSAKFGFPGMGVYSVSKAAVSPLVQTLAAELAPRQIRVTAVAPGFVKTPTMGISGVRAEELVGFEEEGAKITPLGRIASAEEVAKVAVFLAFEATFTTGSEILVDGGLINGQKQ
ncbi:putative short chain dehydrogenase [Aspergillus stella-maris]|uniref:putative short chain dehydrogenase n=1 Tax=Aspergillus stella-maris TaxID=1810926 RepID=UPI003CCDD5C4